MRQQLTDVTGTQQQLLTVFALPASAGEDAGYCVLIRDDSPVPAEPQPNRQHQQPQLYNLGQQPWRVSSARLLGRLGELLGQEMARLSSLHQMPAGEWSLMRALATDLLELSLAESGQLRLECQPLDWAELVRQACARHGLALHAPAALPLPVAGDPLRLAQLLDFLLPALSQLEAGVQPVVAWQVEALGAGRQRLQLDLRLPAALQPALQQWLGYLPGGPPFDGRFSADLKLRLCCHWLQLLDGGLGLLPADELAATTGLRVQLVLASVTT